ncbi:MAG: type 3 dihydrofolate reductase [Enterobacteriaceae bacterium]
MTIVSMIVAMAHDRVIGAQQAMPWHLPADLAWFKRNTLGKPIIMGRKTYETLGRPLPGRHNIVVSRGVQAVEGITWVNTPEQALQAAGEVDEVMVIGGGHLYEAFLPLAQRLYLTHIDASLSGDTWFPSYKTEEWQVVSREPHPADEKNQYPFCFEILQRR